MIFTMRHGVLLFMALAIVSAAFAPVTPDAYAAYLKAAAVAATSLAGLLMHPPTLTADAPPAPPVALPTPAEPMPAEPMPHPAALNTAVVTHLVQTPGASNAVNLG